MVLLFKIKFDINHIKKELMICYLLVLIDLFIPWDIYII